jgi:hypothetical protein
MKMALTIALLLSASVMLAQTDQSNSPRSNRGMGKQVTVTGCVSITNGDYILMKENPADTFQLSSTNEIHLKDYLGKRVEVTGTKLTTVPTSEDATNRTGEASPVTIRVSQVNILDSECRNH